jgi:hypothetical protein
MFAQEEEGRSQNGRGSGDVECVMRITSRAHDITLRK